MATCPKCGVPRPQGAGECPECGIIYARAEQLAAKRAAEEQLKQQAGAQSPLCVSFEKSTFLQRTVKVLASYNPEMKTASIKFKHIFGHSISFKRAGNE